MFGCYHVESRSLLMKDREGAVLDGREGGMDLGEVEGRDNITRLYCMKKDSLFNKRKESIKHQQKPLAHLLVHEGPGECFVELWKKPSEKAKIKKLIIGTALPDSSLKIEGESKGKQLEWKSERIRSRRQKGGKVGAPSKSPSHSSWITGCCLILREVQVTSSAVYPLIRSLDTSG